MKGMRISRKPGCHTRILSLCLPLLLLLASGCTQTVTSTGQPAASAAASGTEAAAEGSFTDAPEAAQTAEEREEAAAGGSRSGEEAQSVTATIEIEDYGSIVLELSPEAAPETVENFVSLARSGFYDGLTFHRIMEGFMMQGGDPLGTGLGGSDRNITGEFSANGIDNPLSHTRGAISMARSSDMNSASSQFFIVQEDALFLDGQYAAFGYVTEGMDVVDAVCAAAEPTDDNGSIAKEAQPVILSITVEEDP